jgi:hypothetical protein
MTTRVVSLICGQWCVKTAVLIWLATSQLNPSLKNKILLFKERKKDETWVSSSLKSVTSSKKRGRQNSLAFVVFSKGYLLLVGG